MSPPWYGDRHDFISKNAGNDFHKNQPPPEIYYMRCSACGYKDTKPVKAMTCSCGNKLQGTLVYKRIGKQVILNKLDKIDL